MSDQWRGPGWWYASDGKWYPPFGDSDTLNPVGGAANMYDEKVGEDALGRPLKPAVVEDPIVRDPVLEQLEQLEQSIAEEVPVVGAGDVEILNLSDIEERVRNNDTAMASVKPEAGASSAAASTHSDPTSGNSSGGASKGSTSSKRPKKVTDATLPASVTRSSVGRPSSSPPSSSSTHASSSPSSGPPSQATQNIEGSNGPAKSAAASAESSRSSAVFTAAVALALLSGILGAMWLRERSAVSDLREEVAVLSDEQNEVDLTELEDALNTASLQNQQLQQQLADMSALVLELPEGRVTEIAASIDVAFADEAVGRLIAVSNTGEYVIWGDGAENPLTDSGTLGAPPTGLFAGAQRAWVTTEAAQVEVLPMIIGIETQAPVDYGPLSHMVPDPRGYWSYNSDLGQIVRLLREDGSVTNVVDMPVAVVDMTIGAGSVWALGNDGLVYRINTADLTIQSFDVGADLISITAGPDALWTLSAADGSLRRIDPVTGSVLVTVPVGRDPIDAMFAGSSVWVALRTGSSMIEVDTATSAVVSRTELSSEPAQLYQGDSGVYVSTVGEGSPLLRIDSLSTTAGIAEQAEQAAEGATDE